MFPDDTIVENVGPATRMITVIGSNAIYYGVEHLEYDGDQKEWVTVWSRTVPFRKGKRHSPGGPAFVEAATVQAKLAAQEGETGNA